MKAESDTLTSLLDKLRAKYPKLMFYHGETADQGKFIHAWKPALMENDPSCIANFLPSFHAILQPTKEEKVTCRLFSYNGKLLKQRTILVSSVEDRGVSLLEFLQDSGLCLGYGRLQQMQAAMGNNLDIKDHLQSLLVEHLGDRVVYRDRKCTYITVGNETLCQACQPIGINEIEPNFESDAFEGFEDGEDWVVNFEEDPPKVEHLVKGEDEFVPIGDKLKVEVKAEEDESGCLQKLNIKQEEVEDNKSDPEERPLKRKRRTLSSRDQLVKKELPEVDDLEKENDDRDSDFDIANYERDSDDSLSGDDSQSDQEPLNDKQTKKLNGDLSSKKEEKGTKLSRFQKWYNYLSEEKKQAIRDRKREQNRVKKEKKKSLLPVLTQEQKDALREKKRKDRQEKQNYHSRRRRAELTEKERDAIREKNKWRRIEKELSGKYLCQICLKSHEFKSKLDKCMNLHKQSFDLGVPCTCPMCHTILENRHILTSHFSEEHSPKTCCPFCLFVVENEKDALRRHIFRRHSERPGETHICEHCSAVFTSKRMLLTHIKSKHEEVKLKTCPQCGKSVKAGTFLGHIKAHTRNLSCLYCNEVYSETQMHQHLRKHFNINPYSCNLCNYFSYRISNVKTHFKRHPGQTVNVVINERLQDELYELDRKAMVEMKQKAATSSA